MSCYDEDYSDDLSDWDDDDYEHPFNGFVTTPPAPLNSLIITAGTTMAEVWEVGKKSSTKAFLASGDSMHIPPGSEVVVKVL